MQSKKMSNLKYSLCSFLRRLKFIQSYLTEPSLSPIVPQKTILSQLLYRLKITIAFVFKIYKQFQSLTKAQKINWFLIVGFIIAVCVKLGTDFWGDPQSGPGTGFFLKDKGKNASSQSLRRSMNKLPSRQQMLKKNASLLSMKQYQSHSNSGSQSEDDSFLKQCSSKKHNKDFKQFGTDIQTQSHEQNMETKRDKFFFTLMGSYKKASREGELTKENEKQAEKGRVVQKQDYEYSCEYEVEVESPRRDRERKQVQPRQGKQTELKKLEAK